MTEIRNRRTHEVIYESEKDTQRDAAIEAVSKYHDLRGANLRDADLRGANLRGANLRGAGLSNADLSNADLLNADLSNADLRYADLRGADLSGANLRGANLRDADLRDADLRGADLSGANLRGAGLRDANLSNADLSGADLSGADLRDAIGLNKYLCTPLLMLLDQPGKIRAYKLTTNDECGTFPHLHNGNSIYYHNGETVSVNNADTNEHERCGAGINIATLDWCMKEWKPGYRIKLVEFMAKDIACIPTATDGKFRLHRCKVLRDIDLREIGLVTDDADATAEVCLAIQSEN